MSSVSKGDKHPGYNCWRAQVRGLAEGYLKAQMPREHNRLYNSTSYATTKQKRSGLRHERRNVPLAAVSAGTVKR